MDAGDCPHCGRILHWTPIGTPDGLIVEITWCVGCDGLEDLDAEY